MYRSVLIFRASLVLKTISHPVFYVLKALFFTASAQIRKISTWGNSLCSFSVHFPAVACCLRLELSLLCVPLLYRPVFATLARCAHLIRLPLSCISAPPPALAHAWCMLVPAFCSSLPVSVCAHHSGSSGVERAEFTPYPSETIEKTYPIRMVKGVYILRIVSVCVCVNIRTSGGAFY